LCEACSITFALVLSFTQGEANMPTGRSGQSPAGAHVNKLLEEIYGEFQALTIQRETILRRIGTLRRTIIGLAHLFGSEVVDESVLEAIDRKSGTRSHGLTRTCRLALMESSGPLTCQQVCDDIKHRNPALLAKHKDALASVNTVLNRLAKYGEARVVVNERGKRAWEWATETAPARADSPRAHPESGAQTVELKKQQGSHP
jgi:hypothetical protein